MMISEKTVELNLTTEIINWIYIMTKFRPYALAPSQYQEHCLGFDTSIQYGNGSPLFFQFKRANYLVRTNEYVYHLNQNKNKDQHVRLLSLENHGFDIYYALPLFHLPSEVSQYKQKLLLHTLFIKPSDIHLIHSPFGDHEIRYDINSKITFSFSFEGSRIDNIYHFENIINNKRESISIDSFVNLYNTKMFSHEYEIANYDHKPIISLDVSRSQSLIVI